MAHSCGGPEAKRPLQSGARYSYFPTNNALSLCRGNCIEQDQYRNHCESRDGGDQSAAGNLLFGRSYQACDQPTNWAPRF